MRVLVTGAGGFGGGFVARHLAAAGFEVFALTRSKPVQQPDDPSSRARFVTLEASLQEPARLPRGIDAVVHAAATSPWQGVTVDAMVTDNVIGTQSLLRWARAAGAQRFVFLSSLSAFGSIAVPLLDERAPSVMPNAYGTTKLIGEQLLADVAGVLPSLAIRLPAVVGPGSWRNWPSETLRKLRSGAPVAYVNPQTRFNNAVHIADLANLVEAALRAPLQGCEMVIVGSSGEMSVGEVVDLLAREVNSTSVITSSETAQPTFLLDWRKAQRMFQWTPMPIAEALTRMARENLSA